MCEVIVAKPFDSAQRLLEALLSLVLRIHTLLPVAAGQFSEDSYDIAHREPRDVGFAQHPTSAELLDRPAPPLR